MSSIPPGLTQAAPDELRGVSNNGVSRDSLAGRLSANPANQHSESNFWDAAGRLARYFHLTWPDDASDPWPFGELDPVRPLGPKGGALQAAFSVYVLGDHESVLTSGDPQDSRALAARYRTSLKKDYDIVMPPLRNAIRKFATESIEAERKKLQELLNALNLDGVGQRLSAAAIKVEKAAGGLSVNDADFDRARLEARSCEETRGCEEGRQDQRPADPCARLGK